MCSFRSKQILRTSIQNQTAITAVQGVIPGDASTENLLVTNDVVSDIADDVRGLDTRVTALEQEGSDFVTLDFDATQYSTVNEALNALYVIINPLTGYQKMNLSIEYAQYLFKCSSGTFTAYDTVLQPGLSSNNLSISYDRFGITNNSYWEKYTWVNGATQMTTENKGNIAPTMHMKVTYPKA